MADVDASGFLNGAGGGVIAVFNAAQTEGGFEEIQTDSNVYGAADVVGTFASQLGRPFVCTGGVAMSENNMTAAYIDSAGKIKMVIQPGKTARWNGVPIGSPYPKTLAAGDRLLGLANTATDREAALCVATNRGEYHIFTVTPSGAAANPMVSILTGESIGSTLFGQVLTHAFLMTEANEEIISAGGCYILDGSGTPTGCVPATNPTQHTGGWMPVRIPIQLNTTAILRTDA
jgi:hypothetical protein